MECFLLGSGGMVPLPGRRLSSMALRLDGRTFLFDCGEGTQVPYKEARLGVRSLDVVAVTHHHADHVLGLPGMLMLRAQMLDPPPLTVLGPPNIGRFIQNVRDDLGIYINYPIRFVAWSDGADSLAYEDERVRIFWRLLDHTAPCIGYRFEERDRPGRFDPAAATRLGVPKGPLWGELQAGRPVEGAQSPVTPDQVLGPARRGRQVAYVTDTSPTESLEWLLEGVDLAFLEGMYGPEEAEDAAGKKHLTVVQAASAARHAKARDVVLIHISPRYEDADMVRLEDVARQHHSSVRVGRDGQVFAIAMPE